MAEPVPYAHSLAFLLAQVGAQSASLFAEMLMPLGVTPRAFGVLSNLAADDGQSQQRLADALGIHRNNMVSLVDELESEGWVERTRSATDRRAFALELTPAGRTIVDTVLAQIPSLDERLAEGLTQQQRALLSSALLTVADGLGLDPGVHPHLAGRPRSATTPDE